MKKGLIMLFLGIFLFSLTNVSAVNYLLTKIDFEVSGFQGITSLDNSNGTDVIVSIHNSSGSAVVVRNVTAGVYLENMTITMQGSKFNLSYSTQYTYNLSTVYGNFLYNFTTPGAPVGASILTTFNDSKSSFTDMGVYVYDSNYGLDWQDGDNGETLNWSNAVSYCADLELGGKDVGSWRLPSLGELVTLIDMAGGADGNYLPSAFNGVNNSFYWTSTSLPSDDSFAYYVDFGYGYIDYAYKDNDGYNYARCVSDH